MSKLNKKSSPTKHWRSSDGFLHSHDDNGDNVDTTHREEYEGNYMDDFASTDSNQYYDSAMATQQGMRDTASNVTNPYAGLQMGQFTDAWAGAQNVFAGATNQFAGAQNLMAQGQNAFANVQTFGDQLVNPFASAQNVYQGAQGVMGGASNVYGGVQNAYANLQNPYENATNAFDNLTVNQQQADFQRRQNQQSQGDIMRQARAGGSGGMGGLVQMLSNQSIQAAAQSSASIGQQESQINMQRAQEDSRMQQQRLGAAFEIEKLQAQGEQQAEMTRLSGEDKLQQMQLGEQSQLQMARLGEASKLQGLDMQTRLDIQKSIMGEKMQAQQMKMSGQERYQNMVLSGAMDVQKMQMMGAADLQKMILQGAADLQGNKLNNQQMLNIETVKAQFEADKMMMTGDWQTQMFQFDAQNMFYQQDMAAAFNADANYWNQMGFNQAEQQMEYTMNNPVVPEQVDSGSDGSCVLSTAAYRQGLIDSKQMMEFVNWRLQTQNEEFLGDIKWLGYQITWKPIANWMLKSKRFAKLIKKVILNKWINVINGKKKHRLTKFFVEYVSVLGFALNYRKCMKLASKFKSNPKFILEEYKNIIIRNDGNDKAYKDFKNKLKRNRKLI